MPDQTTTDPKRRNLCRHIHTQGQRCGSPALRARDFCYYHHRAHDQHPCASRAGTYILSRIDDRAAVQIALFDVLSRLATGDIPHKLGGLLLYGLQIASSNLGRKDAEPAPHEVQVDEYVEDYTNLDEMALEAPYPEPAQPEIVEPAAANVKRTTDNEQRTIPITLAAVQASAPDPRTARYTGINDSYPRMASRRRQLPRPDQAPL